MSTSSPTRQLRRVLSLRDLLFFGIIVIQPTAPLPSFGIVDTVAQGHVATTILIGMFAMVLTAISYGRMASAYPNAGSAYAYVSSELNPSLGFLTGWSIALDYILTPAIGTIWCSKAAMNIVSLPFGIWVALFAIFFTLMNLRGVETNAKTNKLLTLGMSLVLIAFFFLAAGYVIRHHGPRGLISLQPFYDSKTFSWPLVSTGTSIAVLTYMGFDSISTLSEEVEDPRKTILLATVLVCVITGVLGCAEVYMGQLVWPDFRRFPDPDTAFVSIAGRAGGPVLFYIMNATLLVATMGSSLAGQLGSVRLLYAMGRDNAIPPRFFGYLNPKNGIPAKNVLLTGLLCLILPFAMTYETGAELLNFGAFVAFMGVNLSVAMRYFVRAKPRTLKSVGMNLLPPLLGFLVCCYIWASLRMTAKVAGGCWLLLGFIYLAAKRGFFKRKTRISFSAE